MSDAPEKKSIWQRISGGWRTYGPAGGGGTHGGESSLKESQWYDNVTADTALKLSAVHACVALRSEITGSLPINVRDKNKKELTDHPLHYLMRVSPNFDQTPAEYWSMVTAQVDINGNSVDVIARDRSDDPVALIPFDPCDVKYEYNKAVSRKVWTINGDRVQDRDVLHQRGFTMDGSWGKPRLELGRQILGAQLAANDAALKLFRNGLKVSGFFDQNERGQAMNATEATEFKKELDKLSLPENLGKNILLPKGLKPIEGVKFAISSHDAQLLESRYFGIEEICRLFNVPPQLIFHSSKASSWASSIENINLFFLQYSLMPTLHRYEQRMMKRLMSKKDIAAGVQVKFSIQGLLRGDQKSRTAAYVAGLQNGYLSQNDVLALEDRPGIGEEGDVYRVQLNMANAEDEADAKPKKPTDEEEE